MLYGAAQSRGCLFHIIERNQQYQHSVTVGGDKVFWLLQERGIYAYSKQPNTEL